MGLTGGLDSEGSETRPAQRGCCKGEGPWERVRHRGGDTQESDCRLQKTAQPKPSLLERVRAGLGRRTPCVFTIPFLWLPASQNVPGDFLFSPWKGCDLSLSLSVKGISMKGLTMGAPLPSLPVLDKVPCSTQGSEFRGNKEPLFPSLTKAVRLMGGGGGRAGRIWDKVGKPQWPSGHR